jgi:hypothetical protein
MDTQGLHTTYLDVLQIFWCKILSRTKCFITGQNYKEKILSISARTASVRIKKTVGKICSSEALVTPSEVCVYLSWCLWNAIGPNYKLVQYTRTSLPTLLYLYFQIITSLLAFKPTSRSSC